MVRGIHHISMGCDTQEQYQKVRQFYCDVLGLRVCREWSNGMMLDAGAGLIEVFHNKKGVRAQGAIQHYALAVEDVDALAERVRAAGYEVFTGPKDIELDSRPPLPARIAFCYGPLGEEIELFREKN